MPNPTLRIIFMMAIRSGIFLFVAATNSPGQVIPSAVKTPPPSRGSVNPAGKFVPATVPAEISKTPATPVDLSAAASKFIQKTGANTFRVGLVQCDRFARTLTIPAKVNAREGSVEYALVTHKGKIHEALLSTDADPLHVQMAAMLLGMSPQPGMQPPCEVMVEVEWATNGPAKKVALEDLITLAGDSPGNASGGSLSRGPWKFTGSLIDATGFVAEREGSIIALIADPAALVVNPRRDNLDDTLHSPNTAALPGTGIPVSVRIRCKNPGSNAAEIPVNPESSTSENP